MYMGPVEGTFAANGIRQSIVMILIYVIDSAGTAFVFLSYSRTPCILLYILFLLVPVVLLRLRRGELELLIGRKSN